MKKIFTLLLAIVIIPLSAFCMQSANRQTAALNDQPYIIIVMDTTQALLSDAKVKVGKQTFTTTFDGRVVLKEDQLRGARAMQISCEGFRTRKLRLDNHKLCIVRLMPKKGKASTTTATGRVGLTRTAPTGLLYAKTAVPMADGAFVEESMAASDMESVVVIGYGASSNAAISAGKLTAGEVNDFAKWYFWQNMLDSAHQTYIDQWQLRPCHRYTVQVTNAAGYPIASRAVSLLDNSGNTLFQAVTDNTGKAELWYQLVGRSLCGKHTDFMIQVDDQTRIAKQWADGGNTFVLNEECVPISNLQSPISNDVDVMFVFDATGSMGDELRYLQEEMKDVIARASEATGGLKIRTGAVVYRDHGDEYLTRISRLTEEITETQTFIDRQEASGGGDFPEAVPEALMAAINTAGWNENARARIAFLVLDAPCHQDSATVALLHEQILNSAAQGIRIVPVVCSGLDASGEYLMRSIALATNGTSFFLTDDSGIGNTHYKPQTDSLKVEHLNDMLVRTIVEFSTMPKCDVPFEETDEDQDGTFIPNPFEAQDLQNNPDIPHGEGIHYIVDVSGKLITILEGETSTVRTKLESMGLPIGVYFIKSFYNGEWHTQKVLVK